MLARSRTATIGLRYSAVMFLASSLHSKQKNRYTDLERVSSLGVVTWRLLSDSLFSCTILSEGTAAN